MNDTSESDVHQNSAQTICHTSALLPSREIADMWHIRGIVHM